VELLFIEPVPEDGLDDRWRALVRPGRRCRAGAELRTAGDTVRFRVAGLEPDGTRLVERLGGAVLDALERHGVPPLPPYIAHHAKPGEDDRERYQTVYASAPGSVAAPTAGLHFTRALLERLRARGVEIHALTLHVGPATFRPIKTPRVEEHPLPSERVTIPAAVASAVAAARAEGRRVVAVGTTTVRALESAAAADGVVRATDGRADIFIVRGYRFRVVDALLTNFHLPRSSLLVLVSAFAGRDLILAAYRHALAAGYRFYSYGDATLIV
jgi:S-adenosylmethionine:tRNA ribosyltransferase-isomerase